MTQKSLLITGCSSGIGYDAAHCLAKRGWRVFATCRQQKDVERLNEEGLESLQLDYSSTASIEAAMDAVLTRTNGRLDALFNNGAYAIPGAVEDVPTDALREIYEVNVFGYHHLTRLALPVMRAQGHGRVVNNSSVLGLTALPWRGAYSSTKFALEGLTDTLRLEMRGTGIHIALIEPGPITTRIRENSRAPFERWIDWENSARAGLYRKLRTRLYDDSGTPDRFELPPSAVTEKLIHALEHPHPRPRYYVTRATHIAGTARRLMSTRMLDRVTPNG
ncbi:SDR family NAD(P)-dependent oxidoreductase [Aliiroseovarius crassostreae]|uniref:SDR family NAD(P)-dependent oxidoreductase n=1 Tax=Aliiroseovarius crassostreae TaxID=154981 RepID=UPI002207BCEA|nr:SDR family NAD(P)-dependent oxidoreductase [Aliiroseovarius crassostreae]UWQ08221.1 SDR family NAD(P)-dependent oxidoreductase [Aliiroseovarius crassostreae]UWQ11326.1 SDR family NAD(P)-dependent oxidoreductase [Aliiroseovarius crassostreae]